MWQVWVDSERTLQELEIERHRHDPELRTPDFRLAPALVRWLRGARERGWREIPDSWRLRIDSRSRPIL